MCHLQAPTPLPAFQALPDASPACTARRRHMLSLLLLEYEGLLQEYLSCNWDRLAELAEANSGAVRWEGPVCVWHRSPSVPSVADSDTDSQRGDVEGNPQFRRRLSSPFLREDERDAPGGRCACVYALLYVWCIDPCDGETTPKAILLSLYARSYAAGALRGSGG